MKTKLLSIVYWITFTCYAINSNAQANRQLSNLISPTAVNVNLLPGGTTGTRISGLIQNTGKTVISMEPFIALALAIRMAFMALANRLAFLARGVMLAFIPMAIRMALFSMGVQLAFTEMGLRMAFMAMAIRMAFMAIAVQLAFVVVAVRMALSALAIRLAFMAPALDGQDISLERFIPVVATLLPIKS